MAGGSAALEADCKVEGVKDPDLENDEAEEKEEDKLYCVCKTRYDEDRVMIACDRCVFIGLYFDSPNLIVSTDATNGITRNA